MQNNKSSQAERDFSFTTYLVLSPENLTIYSLSLGLRMLVLERTVCRVSVAYRHGTTEDFYGIFELLCKFVGKGVIFFFNSFASDEIKHSWQLHTL